MDLAALTLWIATAVGGLYMAGVVMRTGRDGSTARDSNLPSAVVFGHGFLALAGLAIWALHLSVEEAVTAWLSLGTLVLVAAGGTMMFLVWRRDHKKAGGDGVAGDQGSPLAEQQIPPPVVHLHGALALLTILAVGWVAFSYL